MRWPWIRRSKVQASLSYWEGSLDRQARVVHDMQDQLEAAYREQESHKSQLTGLRSQVENLQRERAVVLGMLENVPIYEGMGGAPLVMLLSGLINDYAELEARIDIVIMEIKVAIKDAPPESDFYQALNKIAAYLKGAPRIPEID